MGRVWAALASLLRLSCSLLNCSCLFWARCGTDFIDVLRLWLKFGRNVFALTLSLLSPNICHRVGPAECAERLNPAAPAASARCAHQIRNAVGCLRNTNKRYPRILPDVYIYISLIIFNQRCTHIALAAAETVGKAEDAPGSRKRRGSALQPLQKHQPTSGA